MALKGNIETREHSRHFRSRNVLLRLKLDLFANVIHCKSQAGIPTRHTDIDLVLIRQNTEGEYSCLEHENVSGVVESLKIITYDKSVKITALVSSTPRSTMVEKSYRRAQGEHHEDVGWPFSQHLHRHCERVSRHQV